MDLTRLRIRWAATCGAFGSIALLSMGCASDAASDTPPEDLSRSQARGVCAMNGIKVKDCDDLWERGLICPERSGASQLGLCRTDNASEAEKLCIAIEVAGNVSRHAAQSSCERAADRGSLCDSGRKFNAPDEVCERI